jgi:hypothetical protein
MMVYLAFETRGWIVAPGAALLIYKVLMYQHNAYHIDIIESANDITSWDGDNELLQPHTEELLQFIRDLQVQFEEMRRSARDARMSAKGKTSSKEDESEDDLEDEDEEDEEPREAPIASGICWILRPSYVFTASLRDN